MAERQSIDGRSLPSTLPTPSLYGNVSSVHQQSGTDDPADHLQDQDNVHKEDDENKPSTSTASGSSDSTHITAAMTKLDIGSNTIPIEDIPDCPVCLQKCIHPVKLPCTHVFCFLCVKGVAMQSGRCALCRKQITAEFFSNPTLLRYEKDILQLEQQAGEQKKDQYTWYYEGRNGWWQYEERTNLELEESYCKKLRTFELLIAGFVYTIDLDNMVQMRRSDPSRRRRIKRDLVNAPKKGIAGLKIAQQTEGSSASKNSEAGREVLGGESDKSNQATGGGPVDGATQTPDGHLNVANQTDHPKQDTTTSTNTSQRGTSTDETPYEVLPQPRGNRTDIRRHSHDLQLSQSEARGEVAAAASTSTSSSSGHSKSNRTNSAGNQKKSKSSKTLIRDSVPRHPTPRTTALENESYGLAVHHQRAHSNRSPPSMSSSGQSDNEHQGAVSRHSGRSVSSRDDMDLNSGDTSVRSAMRRGDDGQTDGQTRSRQVRQRRRNPPHSSDV
ncbi:LOW QUALITY PROTEIN: uncharacterized protein [Amphiura filiformis]|uniref:LOW QUALITY PROTEIN: uncharacterized protein n=1 Tax=Amphiura filiformis TaxID=82378 RepID=UPI003B212A15